MNTDDRSADDVTEERLRRALSAAAGRTQAPDRWSEVSRRIGGDSLVVLGGEPKGADEYQDDVVDYVQGISTPRRRPRVLVAMATLGVVLGATFGIVSLNAGDGAGSPEKAVEELFDAIAAEDPIGVLEAIAPSERDIVLPALRDLGGELERLDVASGALDLHQVKGVDLTVDGLQTAVTPLADDTAVVRVSGGRLRGAFHLADLPFGPALSTLIARDTRSPDGGTSKLDRLVLVSVKEGGGWHIGLQATLGNAVHEGTAGTPGPDLAGGIPAKGAPAPEAAARRMIEAMLARDMRAMIELTPATESRALHQWGPTFIAWSQKNRDIIGSTPAIDQLELAVSDGPDGSKVVRPTSYLLRYRGEGKLLTEVNFTGDCATSTSTYVDDDGKTQRSQGRACGGSDPLSATVSIFYTVLGFGSPPSALAVVEHDGAWFVSPGRSMTAVLLEAVHGLDKEDALRAVRGYFGQSWALTPPEYWKACGVARPAADAPAKDGMAAADRCSNQLPSDYAGPYGGSITTGSAAIASSSDEASSSSGATSTTIVGEAGAGSNAPATTIPVPTPTTTGP